MKKKLGFTLAEVLITLGIIGVVAALTAPALVQNAGTAQGGPKLAKAVSTLENANQNLLVDEEASKLTAIIDGQEEGSGARKYSSKLADYMKISQYSFEEGANYINLLNSNNQGSNLSDAVSALGGTGSALLAFFDLNIANDGIMYGIRMTAENIDKTLPAHRQTVGTIVIDIDGLKGKNKYGKDIFWFALKNDGSLRPLGATGWAEDKAIAKAYNWRDGTSDKCNEDEVTTGFTCAGSIFENNLKVIYE